MVQINFARREITLRLVVVGPDDQQVAQVARAMRGGQDCTARIKGERVEGMGALLAVLAWTEGDRDEGPKARRKLALQGCDGLVFACRAPFDAGPAMEETHALLDELLREQGLDPRNMPTIVLVVGGTPADAALAAATLKVERARVLLADHDASWPHAATLAAGSAAEIAAGVQVGQAFAFIPLEAYAAPQVAEILRGLGVAPPTRPQVVTLLTGAPVDLPGGRVVPRDPPALRLASVTADKMVYREGQEPVRLLVVDPLAPLRELVLTIERNGAAFARTRVRLDARGLQATALRDLPGGSYRIAIEGDDAPPVELLVAEYALAPLTAELLEHALEGSTLRFVATLDTFGLPVEGPVVVELREAGRTQATLEVAARAGRVEGQLPLAGDGPHELLFRPVADAAKQASVPLRGSRREEREPTLVSALGVEVRASLLPGEGAREVRGLWLREGAMRNAPVRLSDVDAEVARLTVQAPDVLDLVALMWEPATGRRTERRLAAPPPGAVLELPVPSPLGVLLVGAFVGGKPWEGWAVAVHPGRLGLELVVPESARPGEEVEIELRAGSAEAPATVYLVVKDDRLLAQDTPSVRLAAGLKRALDDLEPWKREGTPSRTLAEVSHRPIESGAALKRISDLVVAKLSREYGLEGSSSPDRAPRPVATPAAVRPARAAPAAPRPEERVKPFYTQAPAPAPSRGGFLSGLVGAVRDALGGGSSPAAAAPPPAGKAPPVVASAPARPAPAAPSAPAAVSAPAPAVEEAPQAAPDVERAAPMAPRSDDPPEVVLAEAVEVAGQATVRARLGPGLVRYVAEAFALRGLDWEAREARFRAASDPAAELTVPPFAFEGDGALGRANVSSSLSEMFVSITRDGQPVRAAVGDRPHAPEVALPRGAHELRFMAGPGELRVTVRDVASGATAERRRRVNAPGQLVDVARRVLLLGPGDELAAGGDVLGLRVLPGLESPLGGVIDATGSYAHKCCEQTAAKLLTAATAWALATDDPRRRRAAEEQLVAGILRQETMWLRGRGFKSYPERGDEVASHWSERATQHLFELDLLQGDAALSPGAREAVASAVRMADDCATAHGLSRVPDAPRDARESYLVLRADTSTLAARRKAYGAAVAGAATCLATLEVAAPRVVARTNACYLAASLLRRPDAPLAREGLLSVVALANRVAQDVGPEGRLYSTVDSVALVTLLSELRRAGIVAGPGAEEGGVLVDGAPMSVGDAARLDRPIERVAVRTGWVPVEVTRLVRERWEDFKSSLRVAISLQRGGAPGRRFSVGDAVELVVTLEDGYREGDVLHVCLPPALSRIYGGAQVKRFSLDFAGSARVSVPLFCEAPTLSPDGRPAPQRWAACVRNMYEEERAGNPGVLEVTVAARPGSADAAAVEGMARLFR